MVDLIDDGATSGTVAFRYRWDVFLSFRGEDTRHTLTDRLYGELVRNGVRTFRDDDELQRGEEIAPSLLEAIEDSAAAIAVISARYADSRWCLEELARIIECGRILVLPVFYEVDPSDVRRQKGTFEEGFGKQEVRFGKEKVVRWRKAFEKAGSISGWDSRLWDEQELILSVVKKVLTKLSSTPLGVAKYPVGLNSCLEELMMKLDVKANGVRFLGIHGMGGSGKTTIAKALYNKLHAHFKRRSFISNVGETSREKGLIITQHKLISNLSQGGTPQVSEGIVSIRVLLHEEPVLIVLDDVDDARQLHELVGNKHWFYNGSRIIITTRNEEAISDSIVDIRYEMEMLKFPEALQLFCYHAFGREKPIKDFADLTGEIVSLTVGLPLALEVFGSFFYDKRTKKDWQEALRKLRQIRPGELQQVLEISFDGLDEQEKCAFLDIACFFIKMKMNRQDAVYVLKGNGFSGETLIKSLVAKSLIKIIENDTLWMHDQLRDMGRQIIQRESNDLGLRSRLWDSSDILNVLKNERGTRSIEGIALDIGKNRHDPSTQDKYEMDFKRRPTFSTAGLYLKEMLKNKFHFGTENGKDVTLQTKWFKPITNLRFLQIDDVLLNGSFKAMPAELKFLQWKGCSLRTLPSELPMEHLAVLNLSESKIKKPWTQSWCNMQNWNKRAERLLVMNLQGCCHLTDLPDLSFLSALEMLNLERCHSLVKVHKSVGDLRKLLYLNLKDCSNLVEFPSDVSGLKQLEILIFSGCLKLKELPEDMRSMQCLRELLIDDTSIVKIPDSIFHPRKLETFSLMGCQYLKQLPACIGKLSSLKELHLDGSGLEEIPASIGSLLDLEKLNLMRCKSLTELPDAIGNLKSLVELFLDYSSIKKLPDSIALLSHLKRLSVNWCRCLTSLPDAIEGLASLIEFQLEGTRITGIPVQIGALSMIEKLNMSNCQSIGFLPESIGGLLSMTSLVLNNVMITALPDSIGMLERLSTLNINECKQLQCLPASIANLKRLHYFLMARTSVSELPDEFGMLSELVILRMGKKVYANQPQNAGTSTDVTTMNTKQTLQPSFIPKSFSNLRSLQVLDACAWNFRGEIPDEFEKLSSMEELNLSHNNFCSLPSSLRGLSILKDLNLAHCKELKSLPPLPSSLDKLVIANCSELEIISDISNLGRLVEFNLTNCNKIIDVPGLECLKSLRRLYMGGCIRCFPAIKERLAKVALKHLNYLSIPGSSVPDWFLQEIPRVSYPRNREVKSIIVAVVVSLDQQTTDAFRDKLPAIVDIQLKYFRGNDPSPIFSSVLYLMGIPDTNEDHLYLCRFHEFQKQVLMLKDGDRIEIGMRERPYFKGLRLKKYGIHCVFENDDFEVSDEESLDESQRSVSWKVANFIGSLSAESSQL